MVTRLHKNRIIFSQSRSIAPVSDIYFKSFTSSCYQYRTIKPAPLDAEEIQISLSAMSVSAGL